MPRRRTRTDDCMRSSFYSSEIEMEEDLRPTLDRFAEDTSMIGFRYLHSKYKTWFRIIWGLMLVFSLGLTFYQVVERITYYFIFNPLATHRSFDAPTEVQFPSLLICNKMQLRASSVAKYSQPLLKTMCLLHDDEESFLNSTHLLDSFDHVDLRDMYKHSLQNVDDLVLSCEYDKGRSSCIEDVRPILTPQGLCFTVSPNLTVRRPGPETTLTLLLNLETYEIIPGTVSEPGVIVSLYDKTLPATAHFAEGIHLDAGKIVSIPINDMRKLSRHENHCGRRGIGTFPEVEYSRAACKWVKSYEAIEESCGCVPILSPRNRDILTKGSPLETHYVSAVNKSHLLPPCTLQQEVICVENITSHLLLESNTYEECPEDCHDISYSSVVFGGELSVSEVASLVRTDWEEDKEKRLTQFMPAFEIIPNTRIPLVRAVQALASEAQSFLKQSLDSLGIESASDSTVPCVLHNGKRALDRALHDLHSSERMWKHIANYVQLVLSPHLKSVLSILRLNITSDYDIESVTVEDDLTDTMVDQALFDLDLIESGLNRPFNTYGIRSIEFVERNKIVERILSMILATRKCVLRIKDSEKEDIEEILSDCVAQFIPTYKLLQTTRLIASSHDPNISTEYEDLSSKLVTCLQRLKWTQTPKVFEWHDFDISVKEFETLYKEGGKDNQEIVDLLKMRKIIHVDLIEAIASLSARVESILSTRDSFMREMDLTTSDHANTSISQIVEIQECVQQLPPKLLTLRKNSFLRAEWMSRVQRQVAIAQSYSPGTQYDEVNLLLVKVYFAHFKQETIVQLKSYNMFLLLAEIGGTIGLYVGATLLSIAETIIFFFEKRARVSPLKDPLPNHL